MAKQRTWGNQPVSDDRDVDILTDDLADAEARYDQLHEQGHLSESELLEAVELYRFLYPDGEQS
jgi:hypothetical protein